MKNKILAIILAGIWVTVSEFLRNELLFKSHWVNHFKSLGLKFETLPINGTLWMIWSFTLAYLILRIMKKYSLVQSLILVWLAAFVMMWITIYNLQVLPLKLLLFAIPLTMLEVAVAGMIIKKLTNIDEPTGGFKV